MQRDRQKIPPYFLYKYYILRKINSRHHGLLKSKIILFNSAVESEYKKMPPQLLRDLCLVYEKEAQLSIDLSNYFALIAQGIMKSFNIVEDTDSEKSFRKGSKEKKDKSRRRQKQVSPSPPKKKTRSRSRR